MSAIETATAADAAAGPPRRRRTAAYSATLLLAGSLVVASATAMTTGAYRAASAFDIREMLLGLVTTTDPVLLPVLVALTLVVGGAAERVIGARRLLLAYVGGGVATSILGLIIGRVEVVFLPSIPLNSEPFSGAPPIAALLGVAVAASCFTGALWRRRIRLASVFLATTLFLYSASASDLYVLIALPVGLAVGALCGGRRRALRIQRSSHHEKRVLLAALTGVTAIGPVIATIWGTGAGLLSVYGWLSYDPLSVVDGQVCVVDSPAVACPTDYTHFAELQSAAGWIAALPLAVLLVASWGIVRGRRGALGIAIGTNLLVFVGMLFAFVSIEPATVATLAAARDADTVSYVWQAIVGLAVGALVPLIVAVTLFVFRRAVRVASAPGARAEFVSTVIIAALGTMVATFLAALATADGFRPWPGVETVLSTLPLRLLPPTLLPTDAVEFVPVTGWAQAVWYLPSVVFWSVCIVASVRLVLSSRAVDGAADRARAREVLERGGGGTLAFMTTWAGNAYWFAGEADAAVAYRVRGTVAVTLGGVFGVDRHRPEVAAAFVDFCGENGWTPVFYSVADDERATLATLGWSETQVAEEALLDPREWTPAGKKRQDVRTATNRAEREGITAVWTRWAALTFGERAQIRDISEAWVADKSIPEMEFTLGGIDELVDPAVRLMLARDATGRIAAVTSWIPVSDDGAVIGYALDVMRRRHDAMPGMIEFVIGAVVARARADGLRVLSLSGSPLAHHRGDDDRDGVDRFLALLSTLLEPAYGFRSLATFKRKFQPAFTPVWMLYPDPAHLPAIGLALVRCYVPGLTLAHAARVAAAVRSGARRTSEPVVRRTEKEPA